MRLIKICLLAFLLASEAHAGQAGLSILRETRDGIIYLDLANIQKQGQIQRVMSSQDFHRKQVIDGHDYLSAKAWYEVDCAGKQIRQTSLEVFAENMSMGGVVHSKSEPLPWASAGEQSLSGLIWRAVCERP